MKKYLVFALQGAIALIGATGLSACSNEEVVETNPNYNPDTREVNTQFVFNVSTGNSQMTRQTDAYTQAALSARFRGIDNAWVLAGKLPADGKYTTSLEDITDIKAYGLGTIINANGLDPDGGGTTTPESRRVIELSVPVETNNIMFWGKAIRGAASDEQIGKITFNFDEENLSNSSFKLQPRVPNDGSAHSLKAFNQYQGLVAHILNKVIQTTVRFNVTYPAGSTNANDSKEGTLNWSDFVVVKDGVLQAKTTAPLDPSGATPMCPLGEILAKAFVTFNTMQPGEIRAGSGPSVARTMADLYFVLDAVAEATPTSLQEAVAKEVGKGVVNNIMKAFVPGTSTWKDIDDVKSASTLSSDNLTLVTEDLNEFPSNFNVPFGATQLTYDIANNRYDYVTSSSLSSTHLADVTHYMFPAELCYFGNSPLRVTDTPKNISDYPDGVVNWDNDNYEKWDGWTSNAHVLSSSRSIAMQHNINYGTALLESTVQYGNNVLNDNNKAIQQRQGVTEEDMQIIPDDDAFELRGILIGGQEEEVGWNYIAKAASPKFSSVIYDNDLSSKAIPGYTSGGKASKANYTLVWDNWDESLKSGSQSKVYIALELVNKTGSDFWGKNNLIRKDGVFYLVGVLDPDRVPSTVTDKTEAEWKADQSLGITWPAKYALPPYDDNGTVKRRRIFMQDYKTVANFFINSTSLHNAYVSVPDLRSSQISLGLSVDLEWQTGLYYNVILGQ